MSKRMQINAQLTVGPQPSRDEIESLASDGFQTVINFRTAGEEEQPLSPNEEERVVEAAGMDYLHVPVSMDGLDPEKVDRFREKLTSLPTPIFAHCKSGKRAGAMVMMHQAVEKGMSGEETLKMAEDMGFECDVPELKEFVKSYVNERTTSKA